MNIIDLEKERWQRRGDPSYIQPYELREFGEFVVTGCMFLDAYERGMPMKEISMAFYESPNVTSFETRLQIWLYSNGKKMMDE
jgi:hypothetical protein